MSAVMNTIGVAFAYAVLALFAQNAIFTRGLGVSRLIQLVGDERTSSWWFALLLCVTQTLVAPLAYFAGSRITASRPSKPWKERKFQSDFGRSAREMRGHLTATKAIRIFIIKRCFLLRLTARKSMRWCTSWILRCLRDFHRSCITTSLKKATGTADWILRISKRR